MLRLLATAIVAAGCACRTTPAPAIEPSAARPTPAARTDRPDPAPIRFNGQACGPNTAQLTSDGLLSLPQLTVAANVDGPLARTTVTFEILNEARGGPPSEARLRLPLPPGAVFRDLQLEVNGQWQRAGVLPRDEARRVYDAITREVRDPAIVESDEPGLISARVFPIAAGAIARARLTWVQPLLRPDDPVDVLLCGLPEVEQTSVRVTEHLQGVPVTTEATFDFVGQPGRLVAELSGGRPRAIAQDGWVAAAWTSLDERAPALPSGLTVLLDTSASAQRHFSRDVGRLRQLVAALAERSPGMVVQLITFDNEANVAFVGPAETFGDAAAKLVRRGALGATELRGAFEAALALGPQPRVLLISDATATMRELGGRGGRGFADRLRAAGVDRVDVVHPTRRPRLLLQHLVRTSRHPGRLLRSTASTTSTLQALTHATRIARVEIPDARFVAPRVLHEDIDALAAHGARLSLVVAQMKPGRAWDPVAQGGVLASPPAREARVPDLVAPIVGAAEVAAAEAEMRWLAPDDPRAATLRDRVAAIAIEHGLLSTATALIALENEEAFAQWGVGKYRPRERAEDVQEMKRLDPEAVRLTRLHKKQQDAERRFLLATERWANDIAAGKDAGPRPVRDQFEGTAKPRDSGPFHDYVHAVARRPAQGSFAAIAELIGQGDVRRATERLQRWKRKDTHDPRVYVAGGLIARATKQSDLARRWFASTIEFGTPAGLFFIDPSAMQGQVFEALRARLGAKAPDAAAILRAVAAMARRERVDVRPLPDALRRALQSRRRRFVIVADTVDLRRLALVLEDDQHRVALRSYVGPHARAPGVFIGVESETRAERALLWSLAPVIGALYVIEGRTVTHHPFAFDGHEHAVEIAL